MSTTLSTLQSIKNTSQSVDDFLSNPGSLTAAAINDLNIQIELIKGAVRELPINNTSKNDILNRLNQAESILQSSGLTKIERILAVSQILQTVALKVETLCLP